MNRKTLSYALILALAGSVALVGCKKKEEPVAATPPPAATEPAPMPEAAPPAATATVSAVTVGTTAAADKSVAAVTTFKPTDKIIASVKTDGSASNVEVGAKLTYQDGRRRAESDAQHHRCRNHQYRVQQRELVAGWQVHRRCDLERRAGRHAAGDRS